MVYCHALHAGNNPFDVVKTKMQASDARQKYANTLDCFVKVSEQPRARMHAYMHTLRICLFLDISWIYIFCQPTSLTFPHAYRCNVH